MEHDGFQHHALIYEGSDDFLEGTLPFLLGALEAGEPALVAVGAARTQLLEDALAGDSKHVRFLEMEEVGRNPAHIIPLWREFVTEAGGRSARGIGEPIWTARSAAALDECQRHETLLNVAFAPQPAWCLLCPYDAGSLSDRVLEKVDRTHTHVIRQGNLEESASFDPDADCFAGELPLPRVTPEVLDFGLEELSEVRGRVAGAAERAGLDRRGVADLVTAASELAANSIMHGGGTGTLRLWCEGDDLLTEVEDRGRIEEPLVGRLRPGVAQEGGRGLWLANQLCDLVQIRSDRSRTTVRLHVHAGDCVLA